ncbi:hypothetical protein MIB43_015255 [Providencia rettgeri]|uniref:hypothetical protein n=1 Tax=Providencia rettgeri TaxID=587 RepID=UPI001F04DDA7|nr:hypothetical protein [Providencia rettgeri]MCG9951275.1 hypothetical protein [Providencia rettgeri]
MAVTLTLVFQDDGDGISVKKDIAPSSSEVTEDEKYVSEFMDKVVTMAINEIININTGENVGAEYER